MDFESQTTFSAKKAVPAPQPCKRTIAGALAVPTVGVFMQMREERVTKELHLLVI